MAVISVTKENYDQIVNRGSKPVLLDFWAPWCGPCRMVAPIVDAIAEERDDIVVGKVNVDEEMDLATQFGIVSIPTLVVMKNGEKAAQALGYQSKAAIEKLLEA